MRGCYNQSVGKREVKSKGKSCRLGTAVGRVKRGGTAAKRQRGTKVGEPFTAERERRVKHCAGGRHAEMRKRRTSLTSLRPSCGEGQERRESVVGARRGPGADSARTHLPEDHVGGDTVLAVVHEDCVRDNSQSRWLGKCERNRDSPTMPSGFIDSPVKNCQSLKLPRTLYRRGPSVTTSK